MAETSCSAELPSLGGVLDITPKTSKSEHIMIQSGSVASDTERDHEPRQGADFASQSRSVGGRIHSWALSKLDASSMRGSQADRLQRSRERNRIHARKTRQRKKEQMQLLLSQADSLKVEQVRLRQVINEKNTASILVGLFAKARTGSESNEDPVVEELLRRSVEDIPDSTKITELPALILPGQHASKKIKLQSTEQAPPDHASDGIDYDLLGKDRSKCSPEELDRIRRERNRMHAKRTRDRKRVFMEEMGELCRKLEEENDILRQHLGKTDPDHVLLQSKPSDEAPYTVPAVSSDSNAPDSDSNLHSLTSPHPSKKRASASLTDSRPSPSACVSHDQLKALLVAADSCNDDGSRKRPHSVFSPASAKAPNPVSDDNSSLGESQSEEQEEHTQESGTGSASHTPGVGNAVASNIGS